MTKKAPMPPWWVEWHEIAAGDGMYVIIGGTRSNPVLICTFREAQFSNARELADLICQRTKQS